MMASGKSYGGCLPLHAVCVLIGVFDTIALIPIAVYYTPMALICIISSLLLILGASRDDRHLMWPWLVVNICGTVLFGIALSISAILPTFSIEVFVSHPASHADEYVEHTKLVFAFSHFILCLLFITIVVRVHAVCKYIKALHEDELRKQFVDVKV